MRRGRPLGARRRPRGGLRPARRWTAGLAVLAVLVGAGLVWLRDSSLVAVETVSIHGAEGRSGPAIRTALQRAAKEMTTLHIRRDRLRRAVSAYPVVRDIRTSADLPHRLKIDVVLYDPVAVVELDGRRVAVAADATVLPDEPASAALPQVPSAGGIVAGRLSDPQARSAVALLGAAPRALRPLVLGVRRDGAGLHVTLDNGPQLDFGSPVGFSQKWRAASRVLADPRSAGASYVDLRVPQRPVAGPFAPEAAAPDTEMDPAPQRTDAIQAPTTP